MVGSVTYQRGVWISYCIYLALTIIEEWRLLGCYAVWLL
jgi:hypothetical protein